ARAAGVVRLDHAGGSLEGGAGRASDVDVTRGIERDGVRRGCEGADEESFETGGILTEFGDEAGCVALLISAGSGAREAAAEDHAGGDNVAGGIHRKAADGGPGDGDTGRDAAAGGIKSQ